MFAPLMEGEGEENRSSKIGLKQTGEMQRQGGRRTGKGPARHGVWGTCSSYSEEETAYRKECKVSNRLNQKSRKDNPRPMT